MRCNPAGIGGSPQPDIPAMPCLVARLEVRLAHNETRDQLRAIPYHRFICILQLYDATGQVRLPDDLFSAYQYTMCHRIPSFDNPFRLDPLFIFPEIKIRECGTYRLNVILEASNSPEATYTRIESIMTRELRVLEFGQFPDAGVQIWTPLSQHLRDHGVVLHSPGEIEPGHWDHPVINGTH